MVINNFLFYLLIFNIYGYQKNFFLVLANLDVPAIGLFDPTSLLNYSNIDTTLVDNWIDIDNNNTSNQNIYRLQSLPTSNIYSLLPNSVYSKTSDPILVHSIYMGVIFLNKTKYKIDPSDYLYKTIDYGQVAELSTSGNITTSMVIVQFNTEMIPSINSINKFSINLQIRTKLKIGGVVTLSLISLYPENLNKKNSIKIPYLRGISFNSIGITVSPYKNYYNVDILPLFKKLPDSFITSKISLLIQSQYGSNHFEISRDIYATLILYPLVLNTPLYNNESLGMRAIHQNKLIQVKTTSIFGISIIDPYSDEKIRLANHCPGVIGGQCTVQTTSLATTNAISIYGFQLSLAGIYYAIKKIQVFIKVHNYQNFNLNQTDLIVSILPSNFSLIDLDLNQLKNSIMHPLTKFKSNFIIDNTQSIVLDITQIFTSQINLEIENIIISLSYPSSFTGILFTSNKARLEYQYDPAITYSSYDLLKDKIFTNNNIAAIDTAYFDSNGRFIHLSPELQLYNNQNQNITALMHFSIPFVTTQSLISANLTITDKKLPNIKSPKYINYELYIVKTPNFSSINSLNELIIISDKIHFKLNISNTTIIDVMSLLSSAINTEYFSMNMITFVIKPIEKLQHSISLSLSFLQLQWNAGLVLFKGTIGGNKYNIQINSSKIGQLDSQFKSNISQVQIQRNSLGLFQFDLSKIPCLSNIIKVTSTINFTDPFCLGDIESIGLSNFDWNHFDNSQNFIDNISQYSTDPSVPPAFTSIPEIIHRPSPFYSPINLGHILTYGGAALFSNPKTSTIAIKSITSQNSFSADLITMNITCLLNDGVYNDIRVV
ncbi:hypothetical protein cand_033870 [Cryptosporidium andersoni]|uniref:Uncharacterized protein n=1 Tax=Cryptosporidium andersoni TaxID=117008 RepID=A0A1J4MVP4_9CRYT|nr:hypothetical protein cand_033870 [Cryptosporidium andersoni]